MVHMTTGDKDWWGAAELARLYRVPVGTIYRWASEDNWRRMRRGQQVRYHGGDAQQSFDRRRALASATSGEVRS